MTDISPTEISQHRFSTSFRGYDPTEVRLFLQQLSHRLELADERETELRQRIAELEGQPGGPKEVDEGSGDTGRSAPVGGTADEAGEVLAAAQAEAAQLVAQANDEAAKILLRARVEGRTTAAAIAAESGGSAARGSDEGADRGEDSPADLEAAREQVRGMVAEARDFRERVLTDLAKRRRVAHIQLEQLRAAKEKLLESMREARRMVDDTARDLSTADVEARVAADLAGKRVAIEPLPTAAEIEAELQTARQFSIPISSVRFTRPAGAEPPADPGAGELPVAVGPIGAASSETAGVLIDAPSESVGSATTDEGTDEAAVPGLSTGAAESALPEDRSIWSGEFAPTPRVRDDSALMTMRERLRRAADAEAERIAPEPADPAVAADPADEAPARAARIEDLFARLRVEREEAAVSARAVLADAGADAPLSPAAPADADAAAVPPTPIDPPSSGDDDAVLRRRDQSLELIDARLARGLRRTLQDEHSAVLAALRTARGRVTAAGLLPAMDEHKETYAVLLMPALTEAAEAGATMGGGPLDGAAGTGRGHGARLAAALAASLRSKVDSAVAAVGSAEAESAQLIDAIGAAYREWRSERVARFVGDALALAFAEGLYATLPTGASVAWILDDGAEPCRECDDNALAGARTKGVAFPTGHHAPPVHGGCRCLVVPAPATT